MIKKQVQVRFTGVVTVEMPEGLTDKQSQLLADKIALSRILATTENPDAPDEDAFDEFMDEAGTVHVVLAAHIWDAAKLSVDHGMWVQGAD